MIKFKIAVSVCLIVILAFAAFFSALTNDFVNWDDDNYVTANFNIKYLSWDSVKRIFGSFYMAGYQPMTILSYLFDYNLFQLNPIGYHITNLILHLLNCLLVFWLIFKLSNNVSVSFITTILFSIHPLQVESVAWISERKGLLCAFFLLGSIISYLSYIRDKRVFKYYIFSLSLFFLALLSKATAITLPIALLLIEYLSVSEIKRIFLKDKIPFFILSLLFVIITIYAHYTGVDIKSRGLFTFLDRTRIASYCIVFYLNKIFIPTNLSCVYAYPGGQYGPSGFISLISPLLVIALFTAIMMSLRYTKKIALASALFLVTIFPALQFVPVGRAIVADRYMYFPSVWIFYIISETVVWFFKKDVGGKRYYNAARIILMSALLLIITGLFFITQNRTRVWKDSVTLWSDALRTCPSAIAYNHLGLVYQMRGDLKTAILNFTMAIQIDPRYFKAYNNRGVMYRAQGELEKAIADYNKAILINPRYLKAYKNRARVYYLRKEYDKSWEDVHRLGELGQKMELQFLENLKKASGRES